jgi:isoleucyl-tRNA synthetase
MSIGPTVLAQAAESMRKIRNSARFALGNIGDKEARSRIERVSRQEMGLVRFSFSTPKNPFKPSSRKAERYVMHELYNLERTALDGYTTYNFPKGRSLNAIPISRYLFIHQLSML